MTATAKQIDWNKPVQASQDGGRTWVSARLGCVLAGCRFCHGVIFEYAPGEETCRWCDETGTALGCGISVRNTPAPPVPFERNRYMNVRRLNDGSLDISPDTYGTCETAMMYARHGFVTVPVTFRGEWKDGESNG